MKNLSLTFLCLLIAFLGHAQFPVSPLFYGQNYWETNNNPNNTSTAGADLPVWTEVVNSGAKIVRIGGEGYNKAPGTSRTYPMTLTTMLFYPQGYVTMCDNIRKNGCEPMVEVPFDGVTTNISTYASRAAEIVRVLNVVHKRNITYFVIGNEPELDYGYTTASQIEAYIEPIAFAMKSVDPNIKIVGPELRENYSSYTLANTLVSGPNQITDPITSGPANGKKHIDYFSWHRYAGYVPTITTRIDHIEEGYNQLTSWSPQTLPTGIGVVVDEYNLKTSGSSQFNATAWNSVAGDPNSFIGGQYVVDMMAGMIKGGVSISNMWSAKEGSSHGYIHKSGSSYFRKPTYWHYWMMANYMRDNLYIPTIANDISGNPITSTNNTFRGIKTYSSKTGHYVAVIVMNQTTSNASFSLGFGSSAPTGSDANFALNMGLSFSNYSSTITNESTFLLLFDCSSGVLTGKFELKNADLSITYDLANHYVPGTLSTPQAPLKVTLNNPNACLGANTRDASVNLSGTATWSKLPSGDIIPDGLGLSPGFYQVTVATPCGNSTVVFSVHENSPLVDAGIDQTICSVTNTSFALGNSTNGLPAISPGYSWTKSNVICNLPTGATTPSSTNDYMTGASCNTSSQYVLTANDGMCSITDETYVYITNGNPDLYIRDWIDDIGSEPNVETNASIGPAFWQSQDIWFRQVNDGYTNQTKEAVEYAPSVNNFVYVRVKNRGCSTQNGFLHVYWAKASTGLSWLSPNMWNNYVTTYTGCTASLYGDEITASSGISISIPPGGEQIFETPWVPANPNDYNCFGVTDKHHFCLLGRIETSTSPPYGMTTPEVNSIWDNTKDNNNIAWTNIWIDNNFPPFIVVHPFGGTIIRNVVKETKYIKLNFVSLKDDAGQFLTDNTHIRLHFTHDFLKRWAEGGKRGKDIVMINDSTIEITSSNASMDHIFLPFEEIGSVALSLRSFKDPLPSSENNFTFQIVQYSEDIGAVSPQGGQTFYIKKQFYGEKCHPVSNELSGVITGVQTVTGTISVTGNIIIPAGAQLIIQKAKLFINDNVNIKVLPGGILKILNSELLSACTDKKWNGIIVKGNPLLANQLVMDGSFITETDQPLTIEKAKGIVITNSSFIGDGLGTAISLDKMKDFDISRNTFDGYNIGIHTTKTNIADVKSLIAMNVFNHVKTAIKFQDDNHTKLDITCNHFEYTDYAILSNLTNLKDQGTIAEGAGNEFISTSILPNNKIKHTNGNNPKYYYDPTNPISSGINITLLASMEDPICYAYSFDTSSTDPAGTLHAMIPTNLVQESIDKKIVDVYSIPNPNSGQAIVYYSLGEAMQGELTIMDIYGKVVDRIKLNSETNNIEINYSNLANGIYMLSITTDHRETMTKKMIITR